MSTAITLRAGQRRKTIRLRTGLADIAESTARIVRLRREEADPVPYAGVPFDPSSPGDLLLPIAAGMLDTVGTYSVEVEVQFADGSVLKPDFPITIEVIGLGEADE